MDQWRRRGINIHYATENVDAATAMGQLQLNMMGAMAEWYSAYISERTKEAFETFENMPGLHRNGHAWMGFRRLMKGKNIVGVVPIPRVRRIMKKIVELRDEQGMGFQEISDAIEVMLAREQNRKPLGRFWSNGFSRKDGETTRSKGAGREWSPGRCRVAYRTEVELIRPAVAAGMFPVC
jgi:DNA invertase Pin-like site-specific DNA recombinase